MRAGTTVSRLALPLATVVLLGLAGCRSEPGEPTSGQTPRDEAPVSREPAAPEGVEPAEIKLTSPAFEAGQPIPAEHTEDGDDVSPPLEWSGVPEGTKELALICDDPDAPRPDRPAKDPWVHWVLYKIPADANGLPEGVAQTARLDDPRGALQGKNSWPKGQTVGYRGPAPPKGSGRHRYFFKLYALDGQLELGPEDDKRALLEAMSGHVIGRGELIGTYER